MSEIESRLESPPLLGRLIRSIVGGGDLFGLRMTFEMEGEREMLPVLPFEDRVWRRQVGGEDLPPIPPDLIDALAQSPGAALFMDTLVPTRHARLRLKTGRGVYTGSDVVVHQALAQLPVGTTAVFLASTSVVSTTTSAILREHLSEAQRLAWLLFLDGTNAADVHDAVLFTLLVCEVGSPRDKLVRLVDLRGCHPHECEAEIRSAAARRGGEVGRSIVLPRAQLGDGPWRYERYTRAYRASRADLTALGELRPLGELVESIVTGLMPIRSPVRLQPVGDGEVEAPRGMIPVIGGREVTRTGIVSPGRYWAEGDRFPEKLRVRAGDLLFRSITRGPGLVAAVVPPGVEATFEHHVLRLRWKPEVPDQVRELLVAWLASERATEALEASTLADTLRVTGSALLGLEVPYPSDEILNALSTLSNLEQWYATRAAAARAARHTVFAAKTYAEAVPLLLDAKRAEGERVTAAEDSQRFEYRVRNYFPHPIALRREQLTVLPHGNEHLRRTLECAEHLVHYLAFCGLVQLLALRPTEAVPSRSLASSARGSDLRMNWGTSWSVLREAVAATKRSVEALDLPIPQLALLDELMTSGNSPLVRAQMALRDQRNAESHLERMPDSELERVSRTLSAELDEMLGAVRFLADLPLVFVRDYALDPFTGQRNAELEYLRGASVVFERRTQPVQQELARGSLGLLGHDGRFHQLAPWLLLHACKECKRPEVFRFDRKEGHTVKYLAMETGHAWEDVRMADAFARMLAPSKSD